MAKKVTTPFANRALARIERKALERCEEIGRDIVEWIKINGPLDKNRRPDRDAGPHLKDSYYYRVDHTTGDVLIKSRRRYWAYVEFGTAEHGRSQAHVRPAIEFAKAKRR